MRGKSRRFRRWGLLATQCILGFATIGASLSLPAQHKPALAFTARNLIVGSQGYDVDELQNRLKRLGFFHHKVDGVYGWSTYWAVRDFQNQFGMKVTGLANMKTKMRLVKATPNWRYRSPSSGGSSGTSAPTAAANQGSSQGAPGSVGSSASPPPAHLTSVSGISQSDMNLLAHVVYAEARGEPFIGQVAVAAVVINRLQDPKFPHSIPAIVYQPGAFTSVQDGQINLQPNAKAKKAAMDAAHGWDPSHGANFYYNPATSTSPWIWTTQEIVKIGHHIFARE